MPSPFAITTTTSNVQLDADRKATVVFTVFNASGSPIRGRAVVVPEDDASRDWLTLAGETEHELPVSGTVQLTVQIAAPADAPAGQYPFRLDMVDVQNPDENYTEGQAVTVEVPAPVPKPFPWWIVAVAGGVLVIGVVLAVILWPRKVRMPDVSGIPLADARATVTAEGLVVGRTVETSGGALSPGYVVASTPAPEEVLTPESTVVLAVAAAPTSTSTPTPTPEPTSTATPTHTVTPTSTPTREIGTEMGDFVGTWTNTDASDNWLAKLVIRQVNNTIVSLDGFSRLFGAEIAWGTQNVPFTPRKVIAVQDYVNNGKVYLKRTIAVERSGGQLLAEVFYDFSVEDGRPDETRNHTLNKERINVVIMGTLPVRAQPVLPNVEFTVLTPTPTPKP